MKNILISGYYGFHNTGDELVLQEIVKGLRKTRTDLNITVLSADPEYTEVEYGVKARNRWMIFQVLKEIFKTDILISGGGSLLQDKTSKNGILYYLGIILAGKLFRKKVIVFSQGIGPVEGARNIFLLKKILSLTDYISVRDEESLEFLKEVGIKKEIILSGDPVFLLDCAKEEDRKELWEKVGLDKEKKLITVSLRPWENIEKVIRETKKFLESFSKEEYQIRYLTFHLGEDDKIIQGKVPEEELIHIPLKPREIASLISSSYLTIGMRLHSLILAAATRVSFISISYDPKVDALDKEIYDSRININTENISQDILRVKYEEVKDYAYSNKEIKERALKPFQYIKDR